MTNETGDQRDIVLCGVRRRLYFRPKPRRRMGQGDARDRSRGLERESDVSDESVVREQRRAETAHAASGSARRSV
jgi:hypothetical protein